MKKYKPDTQDINTVELPSPEAVADVLAADDDTNDTRADDNAPVDPTVARKDIMDAVTNSIFDSFEILNLPKKPLAAMIATNAALAVEDTFDRYFVR